MTPPDCPRLAAELEVLARQTHLSSSTRKRWIADHVRWHPCPHDYQPPAGLARNPDERQ